jgi:hypothetical protein
MNDAFYHHQTEKTLRNLENENRRLHKEIRETRQESDRIRALIAFHDRLEKDFFSADSLEELVITLTSSDQALILSPLGSPGSTWNPAWVAKNLSTSSPCPEASRFSLSWKKRI